MRAIGTLLVAAATVGGAACSSDDGAPARRRRPAVLEVDPAEQQRLLPEREPNDDRQHAQPLAADQRLSGALARAADSDWYRVAGAAKPRILRAVLTGAAGGDLLLEAYSLAGKRLVRVDNTAVGGGETLPNLAIDGRGVLLRVAAKRGKQAAGAPLSYRLHFGLRPVDEGEELEPNWKRALASTLALGEEAVGYLGWRTDTDWYEVSLAGVAAGSLLRVEYDGVDDVRATLTLRDGRGKAIQRRRGRAGDPLLLANVQPPAERAFVVLRCGRTFNVEGRYSLRVVAEPAAGRELEPNDRVAQATSISPAAPRRGTLADTRDRDVFAVKVDQPSLLRAVVHPPIRLDVAIAVVDAGGKKVVAIDEQRAGRPEVVPAWFVRPPRALIRVWAPHRRSLDPRRAYQLAVKLSEAQGWEREPNDTAETAGQFVGDRVRGFIHPAKDIDHFRFKGEGDVELWVAPMGRVVPKLELLAGGRMIATSGRPDARGVVRLSATARGKVVLRVSDSRGKGDGARPYEIRRGRAASPASRPLVPVGPGPAKR